MVYEASPLRLCVKFLNFPSNLELTMTKLNWGILGTGAIARRFATELPRSQTGTLRAVGSRTQESADAFAQEFGATNAHSSYDALLADPGVQAVYISLPNHLHAEWSIRCAESGKHVLCEKPLATNHAQAMTIIEAARANNVFLMEAFMYRCHPQTDKIAELVSSGAIGEVRLIEASFGYNMGGPRDNIKLQNEMAGGGIMDVGCYPVSMARRIAGAAQGRRFANPVVESDGSKKEMALKAFGKIGEQSGVDEWTTAVVKFPGDVLAELSTSVQLKQGNLVRVWGSTGHLVVPNPWLPDTDRYSGPAETVIELHRDGQAEPELISARSETPLFALEADSVAQHLDARQSPAMSWADSLGNVQTLDAWRREIGLVFGSEK